MIYLDNSSTMIPDEKAVECAILGMRNFGNPSSPHAAGVSASLALKGARADVASAMKCDVQEVYFTSGGSESNNTAIFGLAAKNAKHSRRVITTDSEHPSVSQPVSVLEKMGYEVIRLSTKGGNIDMSQLRDALSQKAGLVSIMQVNNETGAMYDIKKIREEIDISGCGAYFHSDCVQSFMKVPALFSKYCDAASVSAHKIGGIKGVGALYLKKGVHISPFIYGGGQEKGLRSGTENIPGILAFATAAKLWNGEKKERNAYISSLKQSLAEKLKESMGDKVVINTPENSVCSILNFSIPGIKSETFINALSADGICVSASSACSTHAKENSVLASFGLTHSLAESAIRVGLSYFNTKDEIFTLCEKIKEFYPKLQKI